MKFIYHDLFSPPLIGERSFTRTQNGFDIAASLHETAR